MYRNAISCKETKVNIIVLLGIKFTSDKYFNLLQMGYPKHFLFFKHNKLILSFRCIYSTSGYYLNTGHFILESISDSCIWVCILCISLNIFILAFSY